MGRPEFLASDGSGKVYVNLQDKDVVAEVDVAARKVIARWPVAPGGAPVGLAIDPERHRLFIGCRKPQKLVVMSTEDGSIVASVPIGAGVDATGFDHGEAFASTGDGSLTVIGEKDGGVCGGADGEDHAWGSDDWGWIQRRIKSTCLRHSLKNRRRGLAPGRPKAKPGELYHAGG